MSVRRPFLGEKKYSQRALESEARGNIMNLDGKERVKIKKTLMR